MERIIEYQITREDFLSCQPLTIQQFLQSRGYSSQIIITLKKTQGSVLLNGLPILLKTPLAAGDRITIHLLEEQSSEKIPAINLPINIVYEDEDLLVLNKPADMPIHPSLNNYENSLANGLAWYFKQQNVPFVFRCLTRLDRDTSGLTLVAKHALAAGILSEQLAKKGTAEGIIREYLAIVRGAPTPLSGTINAPISRKEGSIMEREINPTGEYAVTHYRTLFQTETHSLLGLSLGTGRTHQIRVHLKHIGCPIIGDFLYNPDMEHIGRQALHSCYLAFNHPITGERMEFYAPLPADMHALCPIQVNPEWFGHLGCTESE